METKRIKFVGGVGHKELDRVFAEAEQWCETDRDEEGQVLSFRFFVRHPRYPKCTAMVESTLIPTKPGVSVGTVVRTISDNNWTPAKAVRQIARYVRFGFELEQNRHGGPIPTPEEKKIKIVKGWWDKQGQTTQRAYAESKGITPRTLRRWETKLLEEGKL